MRTAQDFPRRGMLVALGAGVVLASVWPKAASAQTVTITGMTQRPGPVPAGQEAFFYGTVTNTDPANPVTLGALSVDFSGNNGSDGSYLTQDLFDDYSNNVLDTVTLSPMGQTGDFYTGELFGIITYTGQADPATDTPTGAYNEDFTLSDANGNALAVSAMTVTVTNPAPEPAAPVTMALGGLGLTICLRRRRRATPA